LHRRFELFVVLDATPALSHNIPALMKQARGAETWLALRKKNPV
jgi:hypothetical protein